jgi:hypothetical protein
VVVFPSGGKGMIGDWITGYTEAIQLGETAQCVEVTNLGSDGQGWSVTRHQESWLGCRSPKRQQRSNDF